MKKKVLFMLINMNIGGTEKALLNMIEEMPEKEYDITILLLENQGGFLDDIPSNVHVKTIENYSLIKEKLNLPPISIVRKMIKDREFYNGIKLFIAYLMSKFLKNKFIYFKHIIKKSSAIHGDYDFAVAYAGPMDFISFFVLYKINAKRKIQWIHFDIEKIGFESTYAKKIYRHFDEIKVVSEAAKTKLIKSVPVIQNKTDIFLNVVSNKKIINQSNNGIGFKDNFSGVRILTVGRLSLEKGQDIAIKVLARLINEGYSIRWYCIGDGNARKEYEELIQKYNVQDHFILMGTHSNPYLYMKECNLYVQPSRHEGYCITLAEIKCFNKPIVTTNFTGAAEQITDGKTGFIVNFDENELYSAIKTLLLEESLQKMFSENLLFENSFRATNDKVVFNL